MTDFNASIAFVVPAAGVGARMQANKPKQYIQLGNKTVLEHTIDKLNTTIPNALIIVAISEDDAYFPALDLPSNVITVLGGKQRADSVLNALNYLTINHVVDWVLVHDAARPLVLPNDILKLISTCQSNQCGGILASKVRDTIKQGSHFVDATVPRETLWQAQTPQMFLLNELTSALTNALNAHVAITDEASAIEWAGGKVQLIESRADNIKLTTPDDIAIAEFLIAKQTLENNTCE
jgi:2-C-methyl-D-erythritol 4-phosphate cytidylyltransferase